MFARGTKCSLSSKMPGYCKLGLCLTYFCFSAGGGYSFCASSKTRICTAKCEGFHTTNVCYSKAEVSGSGARIRTPNGAICSMSGDKNECSYGPCSGTKRPSTSKPRTNAGRRSVDVLKILKTTKSVDFGRDHAVAGTRSDDMDIFSGVFLVGDLLLLCSLQPPQPQPCLPPPPPLPLP